jgi:hypothetical protein
MATLKQIQPGEVKHLDFPEILDFQFLNDAYKVEFTKPVEIRMSYYVRDVKIFKNNLLVNSGQSCDPEYLELISVDKRFLFIPFQNSYSIFDLQNQTSIQDDVYFLCGNQFDKTGKYLLTIGYNEYKLTDLEIGKVILNHKDERLFISQAHFSSDNTIWTIKKNADSQTLVRVNPANLETSTESIPSPFEFFNIDKAKYQKLVELNKHCVWISKGGGMLHSSLLDSWQYVKTKDKTVYKSAVPISEIRYSKNYNTDTCDTDFFYVTVEE